MSKFDELKEYIENAPQTSGQYPEFVEIKKGELIRLINACLKEREETLWRDVLSRDGCGNPTYETLDEWRIGEEYL